MTRAGLPWQKALSLVFGPASAAFTRIEKLVEGFSIYIDFLVEQPGASEGTFYSANKSQPAQKIAASNGYRFSNRWWMQGS
jgi:hypothetical protein